MKISRNENLAKHLLNVDEEIFTNAYEIDDADKFRKYIRTKKAKTGKSFYLSPAFHRITACLILVIGIAITVTVLLNSKYNRPHNDNSQHGGETSALPKGDENSVAPKFSSIYYDSFVDLKKLINRKDEEALYAEFIENGVENEQIDKVKFFVEKFRAQNIVVPYLNGNLIELRNEDGFSNITLFVSEAYKLPWIWYYPSVATGENFYIKLTYLPENIIKTADELTASSVIKALSPDSPNVNNPGKQHEKVYTQVIKLSEREVTALVYEYKTDNRNSFLFVYEDILVEVRCAPMVWDAQWFSALSFEGLNK